MIITQFWCPGQPRTKGSLSTKTGTPTDTPQSKVWRRVMAGAVRDDLARRWPRRAVSPDALYPVPYAGAVAVTAYWFLPRQPTVAGAGDIDKLLRNLLDALSAPTERTDDRSLCGSAYADDNQVETVTSWKFYEPANPGVLCQVRATENDERVSQLFHATLLREKHLTT